MRASSEGAGTLVNVTMPISLATTGGAITELVAVAEVLLKASAPAGVASRYARALAAGWPEGVSSVKLTLPPVSASRMAPRLALPLLMGMLPALEGTSALARNVA